MTNVEKALEAILAQPECKLAYEEPIDTYLAEQINDTNTFMITAVFAKAGEKRKASIILNNSYIDNLDWSKNPAHNLVCDLIFCECSACITDGVGSITDIYSNSGTPIFYIDPATGSARRLREKPVNTVPMTADLLKLVDELKQVPGVVDVEVEEIIDPKLLETAGPDSVYIRCTTNIPPLYYAGLVIPKSALDNTEQRQAQVDKIRQLLTS